MRDDSRMSETDSQMWSSNANLTQSFVMPKKGATISQPGSPNREHLSPDTSKLNWIEALVAVRFDLTDGQVVEAIELANKSKIISPGVQKKICFLSLPDHNTGNECDWTYTFRIRSRSKKNDFIYCFNFFRQQRDDSSSRGYFQKSFVVVSKFPFVELFERAAKILGSLYFQFGEDILKQAIQEITSWPLLVSSKQYSFSLLGSELSFVSPKSFPLSSKCSVANESRACNDNNFIQITLKDVFDQRNRSLDGDFTSTQLFSIFGSNVTSLWHLWEMVLTGESLLVLSSNPERVSNAVLSLVSLISPLNYDADYRPYFTIYDDDFNTFAQPKLASPAIIGVTNPYFLKAYSSFPNLITLPKQHSSITRNGSFSPVDFDLQENSSLSCFNLSTEDKFLERDYVITSVEKKGGTSVTSTESSSKVMKRLGHRKKDIRLFRMSTYSPTVLKRGDKLDKLLDNHEYESSSFLVKNAPIVSPDPVVLNQLFFCITKEKTTGNHSHISLNNQVLRQHFYKLTKSFLKPLELFLDLKQVSMRKSREHLGLSFSAYNNFNLSDTLMRFNVTEFLKFLDKHPPSDKNLTKQLYRKFILGPNFKNWYIQRVSEIDDQLNKITKHLRFNIDALSLLNNVRQEYTLSEKIRRRKRRTWLGRKREDEILLELFRFKTPESELIRRIEDAIKYENRKKTNVDEALVERMEKHLRDVKTIKTLGLSPTRGSNRSNSVAATKA